MRWFRAADPLPDALDLTLGARSLTVRLVRNSRAKRYILRVPASGGDPVLTVPARGTLETAKAFAERQRDWLSAQLEKRADTAPFAEGACVPLRGVEHVIEAAEGVRGLVRIRETAAGPVLSVPGGPDHLPRRLRDWFKGQARKDLEAAVARHADALGRAPAGITLRDTRSRWGSCSATGNLSFSWRLVLAPPTILDYVAAHEVAHLAEMNHGPDFWRLCRNLAPQTDEARVWLRQKGGTLHLYG
ncbi:M48 family metallopeptidase [Stappia stellulata]|uniref:M48 family metallopeptidase n=1 Tax=Stappia stellulata TaxID=71235 RepID=UPI0003FC4C69|nr:SprT family zinc-dependent metalloprotease [Stappia stellulata]